MQKVLLCALAMMTLVACSNNEEMNNPSEGGEKEQSYLVVSLMADDMTTRAADDEYEAGDPSERVVESLYFFLFDEEGNAFRIDDGKSNYKSVEINEETDNDPDAPATDEAPNVSDLKNKVLVFENHKGEYPAKIVAALNWEPAPGAVYDLDDLAVQLSGLKNSAGAFVMSNAVYAAESEHAGANKEAIKATALSVSNIGKTVEEALANPVKIYVERISAKVTVESATEKYVIGKEVNGKDVYAKVLGWDFFNEYEKSTLLKNIDPKWTDTEIGFSWNDVAWFRSYWAISPNPAFVDAENMVSYNSLAHSIGGSGYCGENTYNPNRTKVVVKALLVDESNNPVEVATWYGNDYIGEEALRTVVANTIASQLYYIDGVEYKSIKPEHLKVVEASEPNPDTSADLEAYHVFFQLSADGEAKEWYTYSSADGFKAAADDAVNILLGGVEPALLYKGGQTYYYTDIKHLPSTVAETQYGIVRNHVYKVNINSISGFGTPVYNGDTQFNPETPEDVTSYVSAEIRILSWRVVGHEYDI